VGSEQSGYKSW